MPPCRVTGSAARWQAACQPSKVARQAAVAGAARPSGAGRHEITQRFTDRAWIVHSLKKMSSYELSCPQLLGRPKLYGDVQKLQAANALFAGCSLNLFWMTHNGEDRCLGWFWLCWRRPPHPWLSRWPSLFQSRSKWP